MTSATVHIRQSWDGARHPHQTFSFVDAWAEHHGGDVVVVTASFRDGSAMLPLVAHPDGSYRSARYSGLICRGSWPHVETCLAMLCRAVAGMTAEVHVRATPTQVSPVDRLGEPADLGPTFVVDDVDNFASLRARTGNGVLRDITAACDAGYRATTHMDPRPSLLAECQDLAEAAGKPWPDTDLVDALRGRPDLTVALHVGTAPGSGQLVAAALELATGSVGELWASAFDADHAKANPSKLVHWHMLSSASHDSAQVFHLGGPAPGVTDPSDGLYRYKLRCGARVVRDIIVKIPAGGGGT